VHLGILIIINNYGDFLVNVVGQSSPNRFFRDYLIGVTALPLQSPYEKNDYTDIGPFLVQNGC
jgi:hypothetical protein